MVPLCAWPTYLNMDCIIEDMKVSDLLLLDKTWNVELIVAIFSAEMMKFICSIPVPCGAWLDRLS